ncbi:GH92 family glycosyl hydrolase [Luteimicrobium sp. NPDC057192]|uniref:GH92 family glycosyl hydrolase n=1 Tax=Luteimicrobium sp. NPDC057192 TaxID=3346042 RepID=UPI00362914B7
MTKPDRTRPPGPPARRRSAARAAAAVATAVTTTVASLATGGAAVATADKAPDAGSYATSFEESAPVVSSSAVEVRGGAPDVHGVSHGDAHAPGLETVIDDGPDRAYNAKANVGFTGLHALRYEGHHSADGDSHAVNRLLDVDVPVGPDSRLSYLVFPDFDEKKLDRASSYVSIDLAFTDGTYLSDLGAVDQHGVALTPRAQGDSHTVYPLQWNHQQADIGKVAAGKTIDRILLSFDAPKGAVDARGWIDDLTITGNPKDPVRRHPSDWVLTTRGTQSNGDYSRGNSFPATAVPNGFNFWTPTTDAGSLGTMYSYNEKNDAQNLPRIQAFEASHETSIWMGDRQTFQVMPSVATGVPDASRTARALPFRHMNEVASPFRYAVTFENGLKTEIAPTDHAAMFRFTFPEGGGRKLIFDNVDDRAGLTLNDDGSVQGWSETRTISAGNTRMFMYATFDRPVTGSGTLASGNRPSTAYVSFAGDQVQMRIATSLISVDQARKNLEQEIAPGDGFDDVADRARRAWDDRLSVVEVEGATDDQLTTLYSNLYRMNLYPNSAYENTGTAARPRYRHAVQSTDSWDPPASTPTTTGAPIAEGKVFVNTGFWDTHRSEWPGYALLWPKVAGELVDGFVQQYRDGGWVSPWSSPGYARVMTGTSSDAAFADAYVKGVPGIDARDTYDAALKNATVRPLSNAYGRGGLDTSIFVGWSAFADSMDGYVNDAAIGQMAAAIASAPQTSGQDKKRYREESEYFASRALGYTQLYDASTGFFQGRSASGAWTTPTAKYDPEAWGNDGDYDEANGWNDLFMAPEDGQGLANLFGGRDRLAEKLDAYFATPETALKPGSYGGTIHEMRETRDLGLGQWSIPNQISYHIPWMYSYTQQPWKGEKVVREALQRGWVGAEIGQGGPGDEDNGASSSWQVLSSLGIYPLQLATGTFVLGSPTFEKATLHLPGGDVVLEAPGTQRNIYVQSVTVNGRNHSSTSISQQELAHGAVLRFTMGSRPGAWGTGVNDVPVSATRGDEVVEPMKDVTGPSRGVASAGDGTDVNALFDNSSTTSAALAGENPGVTYAVNGGKETKVVFYTLTSSDKAQTLDPTGWVLEGSTDGRTWTRIDKRTDETFRWRNETRPFKVTHAVAASQYRIRFTGATGSTSLAEVELLTRDRIPASPVTLDVSGIDLRAGQTADLTVTAHGTGDTPVDVELTPSLPDGWTAEPATRADVTVPAGDSVDVHFTVTPPADVAPGTFPLTVVASWPGWHVTGSGSISVTGDVTELTPGTPEEAAWLVEDDGSKLGDLDGGKHFRYADETSSFVYRLPLAGATAGTLTLDIANQYDVSISHDRTTWVSVLSEPGQPIFQSNRAERSLDLATMLREAGGQGDALYVRIGDSSPADGWGGWLAGVRFEVSTPTTRPTIAATATPVCVAGKVTLAVRAVNEGDGPADVTLTTPFGTTTVEDVAKGASVSARFPTRTNGVEGSAVTASGTWTDGATAIQDPTFATTACS